MTDKSLGSDTATLIDEAQKLSNADAKSSHSNSDSDAKWTHSNGEIVSFFTSNSLEKWTPMLSRELSRLYLVFSHHFSL